MGGYAFFFLNFVLKYMHDAAKNVVLAGVKSVTVYDPEPVKISDLSSQVCSLAVYCAPPREFGAVFPTSRRRRKVSCRRNSPTFGGVERICSRTESWWSGRAGDHGGHDQGFPGMCSKSGVCISGLSNFILVQAVVLCGVPLKKQLEINDWTHQNGVHFISADTRGLFAYAVVI